MMIMRRGKERERKIAAYIIYEQVDTSSLSLSSPLPLLS
jgi:hypothetical protein